MNKLEILVGNIASGKSTYAQQRALQGAIIVNDDCIVNAIHEGNYKLYDESLKPLYKETELFIVRKALSLGKDVIVNRPNQKRKTRQRYASLGKEMGAKIVVVKFKWESPEVHGTRRYHHDARGYSLQSWINTAYRIHDTREWVMPEEYDEVIEYGIVRSCNDENFYDSIHSPISG